MSRIGVFLCNCNHTLDKSIDFAGATKEISMESDVTRVVMFDFLCSPNEVSLIAKTIKQESLDAAVIGACGPEFIESSVKSVLELNGINPEIALFRNLQGLKFSACGTLKAKSGISRGIARARFMEKYTRTRTPVSRRILIIGAGIAGIETALKLADKGIDVVVLEREETVGGMLRWTPKLYLYEDEAGKFLTTRYKKLMENDRIKTITNAQLKAVEGNVGNFAVTVSGPCGEEHLDVGAIVIATGNKMELPKKKGIPTGINVIGQSYFDRLVLTSAPAYRSVVFILDMDDQMSRYGSVAALNGALNAKDGWGSEVSILCQDMKIDGPHLEALYREARQAGVMFFKFIDKPKLSEEQDFVRIRFLDQLMGKEEMELKADLVVLEEIAVPSRGFAELEELLGINQQNNVFLYPVKSNRKGIYYAGACRGDLGIAEVLDDAQQVSAEITILLGTGEIAYDSGRVYIEPSKCILCLTCIRSCPHKAIGVDTQKRVALIADVACEACGVCVGECPAKAIKMRGNSDAQFVAELEVGVR